ncbi:zinc ribbon domain-containing protein [Candidatus Poribacteria bacterium]|nr:MAG: zinc ribbon domain-containing protein [Candidatus Poribacteria bacterium]
MPVYEFHCKRCGLDFEELCSMDEVKSVRCPSCGSGQVDRRLSVFGFSTGSKTVSSVSSSSACSACTRRSCAGCR